MCSYKACVKTKKDQRVSTARKEADKAEHEQTTDQTRGGARRETQQIMDVMPGRCRTDFFLLIFTFFPLFRLHMGLLLRSCVYHSLYPILQRVISSSIVLAA